MSMTLKLLAAAGLFITPALAQAAPTIVPTTAPSFFQGEADDYAHVCLSNTVNAYVLVWTTWDVGDAWYPVILGAGTEMVYRLTAAEIAEGKTLKVRHARYRSGDELVETVVDTTVGNEAVTSCEGVSSYQFVAERDTGNVVLVPVVPQTDPDQDQGGT